MRPWAKFMILMVPKVSESPTLIMYRIAPMVSPYAMVLNMVASSGCLCFFGYISPYAFSEAEHHDQKRKPQEHFPVRYVGSEIVADRHVYDPSYEGSIKASGSSDKRGEYYFHIPGGINKARRDIPVVEYGQRPG